MKRFIIVIWSITCLSCTDFLNLKPDNKQVVYTLEDVKVSMSTYLWALCSPNQITVYFNNVMIIRSGRVQSFVCMETISR